MYLYTVHPSYTPLSFLFFFNDTAPTEIYTLSLHDALPILRSSRPGLSEDRRHSGTRSRRLVISSSRPSQIEDITDRKSTRLNSSHVKISYAVFCLKKKNTKTLALKIRDRISRARSIAGGRG